MEQESLGNCQTRINNLIQKIKEIQMLECIEGNCKIEASLQAELSEWLSRSEILWRQNLKRFG